MSGVATGFFDGVHLGHQAVLAQADTVLTFRNHPLSVLAPERAPALLMSVEERLDAIRACGVKKIVALAFTSELAALPAEAFAARYLEPAAGASRRVFCGANWRFGRGGAGDAAFLRARGYDVVQAPFAAYRGERISSTRIRSALARGDVADARAMLGRPYGIRGTVRPGKGLGRGLGFPTVNVHLAPQPPDAPRLTLPRGVYAVSVRGARAVANFGVAPTAGDRQWPEPVLEIHFLDAVPELPSTGTGPVLVLDFLRPERPFDSLGALRRQIAADCAAAADRFAAGLGPDGPASRGACGIVHNHEQP